MAFVSGTTMSTAGVSTLPLPELVQQTRSAPTSPGQHLSYFRFPLCLQSSPTEPNDSLLFRTINHFVAAEKGDSEVLGLRVSQEQARDYGLSGETEAMGRLRRVNELRTYHGQALPRSVSVADLKACSKNQLPDTLPTIRIVPSFNSLRSCVRSHDPSEPGSIDVAPSSITNTYTNRHATLWPANNSGFEEKRLRRKVHYKSYQDLHILSMYQEANLSSQISPTETVSSSSTTFESESESSINIVDSSSSHQSSPAPKTPTDKDSFSAFEGCEEVRDDTKLRTNTRQVHVIENRQEDRYFHDEEDGDIVPMQTTVLTVPGKPRLIQIHRPQLSGHSLERNISNVTVSRPSTPPPCRPEVSTFSPYDTLTSGTPFSDLSRTASEATPTPKHQPRLTVDTSMAVLQQRCLSDSQTHTVSDRTRSSTKTQRTSRLADPFGSPLSCRSSRYSEVSSFWPESPPQLSRSSTMHTTSTSDRSFQSQVRMQQDYQSRLESTISNTSKAADASATRGFDLRSVELRPFRSSKSGLVSDRIMLANLRRIFPRAKDALLSQLAAWLLVDSKFVQVFETAPPKLSYPDDRNRAAPDVVFSACNREGMTSIQHSWTSSNETLSSPLAYSERYMSSPINTDRIPSKAMSILGIHTDPAGRRARPFAHPVRMRQQLSVTAVEEQAREAHRSVQKVARKLIQDLLPFPTQSTTGLRHRSIKMKHMRGRSSIGDDATGNTADEVVDSVISGLWEACRCMTSLL